MAGKEMVDVSTQFSTRSGNVGAGDADIPGNELQKDAADGK